MTNESMTNLLPQWYEKNGRELPWRVKGGPHPDPYVILVSEFMLQQTTVKNGNSLFSPFYGTLSDYRGFGRRGGRGRLSALAGIGILYSRPLVAQNRTDDCQ